jgi:hypothetical protein
MRSRRVTPYLPEEEEQRLPTIDIVMKRGKKVGKWAALIAGVPLGYIWLPFSCCFRNPVSRVVFGPVANMTAGEKMADNLGVVMFGCAAFASCGCCCFGCCGSIEPRDV